MAIAEADTFRWARINLTHVCARWRAVALDHAPLWAHIQSEDDRRGIVPVLFARSKQAPLYINFNVWQRRLSAEAIGLMKANLARVRVLDLICPGDVMDGFISMLAIPAPELEQLTVMEHQSFARTEHKPIRNSDSFLGAHFPKLRTLTAATVNIDWTSSIFYDLKSLEYLDLTNHLARPEWADCKLAEMLNQCLALKELKLRNLLPDMNDVAISLPRLHRLDLFGCIAACSSFSAHLGLPVIQHIRVGLDYANEALPYRHSDDILTTFSKLIFSAENTLMSFVVSCTLEYFDIEIKAARTNSTFTESTAERFQVTVTTPGAFHLDHRGLLENTIKAWKMMEPEVAIRTLNITHRHPTPPELYATLLALLPTVRTLRVVGPNGRSLVCMICEYEGSQKLYLPCLQELAVDDVPYAYLLERNGSWTPCYRYLIEALGERKLAAVPVHTLRLRSYGREEPATMDALRAAVTHFHLERCTVYTEGRMWEDADS